MPLVPRATAPTVQTQVTRQPTAQNAPASAFASPVTALAGATQDFMQTKQRVDTSVAEDALVKFERAKNDMLFNPEKGYFNTQGKNAVDGSAGAMTSIEELRKQYIENLDSSQAQEMFGRASSVHVGRSREAIMKHSAKGQKVFEIANQQAAQENSIENAALYWGDQEQLTTSMITGLEALSDQLDMEGITDGPARAERIGTFHSAFARTAIESALDHGDIAAAQELTDKAEKTKRLEGPDLNIVNKKIKAETDKSEVLASVDRIYSSGLPRADQLEQARSIEDPDRRKEVERILTNQLNADKVAFDETRRETYDARWKAIDSGTMKYSDLSIDDIELLSPAQLQNLQKAEQVRMSGNNVPDNYILMRELESMSRNDQAKLHTGDYVGQLSKSQMNQLQKLVSDANSGGGETVRTKAATATAGVTAILGRKPKPKSASDNLLVNTFNELLEDEIAALEGNKPTGQKITPKEITDISNRLSRKFVEEDALLGFIDKERSLKSIPVNHQIYVPQIADELRKAGYAVTPENIFSAYQTAVNVGDIE